MKVSVFRHLNAVILNIGSWRNFLESRPAAVIKYICRIGCQDLFFFVLLVAPISFSCASESASLKWGVKNSSGDVVYFDSAISACEFSYKAQQSRLNLKYPMVVTYTGDWTRTCYAHTDSYDEGVAGFAYDMIGRRGECGSKEKFDIRSGACEKADSLRMYRGGISSENIACAYVGNPINLMSGNKFQIVSLVRRRGGQDFEFSLYYNSPSYWSSTYSANLYIGEYDVSLRLASGEEHLYKISDNNFVSLDGYEVGRLSKVSDGYRYEDGRGRIYKFDARGRLASEFGEGSYFEVVWAGNKAIVKVDGNQVALFTQNDARQLLSFEFGNIKHRFYYDSDGVFLKSVSKTGDDDLVAYYHYEDPRDPTLLTGITDERGVRYATWSYDDQGRAVSSEHAGGAEKVTLAYNDDGSTTVTNALGKQTTYRFQVIQGVKRITAIEGEPTADCPAANSTYTYNDRGQVLTATDAEGRVTRYAYNDRGLEISRIEGEGTAEARTVTTDWDAERYRRTQVTADGRRTLYSYDDQGRLLSERTEAVSAN